MNSKQASWYTEFWAEFYAIIGFAIGLLVSINIKNSAMFLVVLLIFGLLAGRLLYGMKRHPMFPYYLIVMLTFIGFIIGNWLSGKRVNILVSTLTYFLTAILSYQIHKKGYV